MANEKNDICDIVKKCKILLLDIEGTTTSISFVKEKLFPYAEENVKDFLDSEWESESVKECVTALRKLALEDEQNKIDGVVTIPGEDASKEDQIEGLVKSVKWQMSSDRKVGPLKQLQGLIWKKGYDKGDIKGHVYDDVSPALELWRSVEGQKVYIYSSGSVQAQKLLFGLSSVGDMLKLIDGHFDTAVGAKQDPASYTAIAEKIGCKPEEILFLTDIDKEAEAARSAGFQAALVSREGNEPLAEAVTNSYPVLYSFAELAATNKRKPDVQEEQPAKILKTDVEADVKTVSEIDVDDHVSSKKEEPEKMEVDEDIAPTETEVIEKVETIVEEVTDINEVVDVPICDAEPVIVEDNEKADQKETEVVETVLKESLDSVSESKENDEFNNGNKDAAVAEETPPAVITEIKDITNSKESLNDVVEIIDDIVPIVEEPPTQDMEDLQNVGEVLEKECDEILSKVQDVTNLDNIPIKPLLNTIAEETMETDNTDSNDIVDRILDRELELEMKQSADIELNEVKATATESKEIIDNTNSEKKELLNNDTGTIVTEERAAAKVKEVEVVVDKTEEICASKEKVQENPPTEDVNNSSVEETTKNSSTEELIKEGISKEKVTKESSPKEHTSKASNSSQEKMEETIPTNNAVKESSTPEEQIDQSSLSEVKTQQCSFTSKQVEKVSAAAEKVVEDVIEENKEQESSTLVDPVNTSTTQIVEECTTVEEVKMGPVVEDTKITDEKVENKIETDVNLKTDDIKHVEKNNVPENKKNTQEHNMDCEESVNEKKEASTEPSTEIILEKLTEETSMEIEQPNILAETNKDDKTPSNSETDDVKTESTKNISDSTTTEVIPESDKVIHESATNEAKPESVKIASDSAANEDKLESVKIKSDSATNEIKPDNDSNEQQLNGNTTNGDTEMINLNGDASKDDELNSRLSMENGQEVVNGANGDTNAEKTKNENSEEDVKEVADMKVKTVAMDEPRNDPIEQPMEA